MTRPTVRDLAREAGVSLATIDRVMNGRPGVRPETIARVKAAIERIGYLRDASAANLARRRGYRFAAVLPEAPSQFASALADALREAHATQVADRVDLSIIAAPSQDPHAIVRALEPLADDFDGVAIMAPETPQLRDAVARLKERGLAVVALASDLPTSRRDYFIGIDNVAAGRSAAQLMGRFSNGDGEVLVATHSLRARDSLERRQGFDAVMARDFPRIRTLPTIESYDDTERMSEIVAASMASRPNLVGVYSMGVGNRALLGALRRIDALGRLVVIAHEVTPATRRALNDGEIAAVIAQNVGHLGRSAFRVLRSLCDGAPIFDAQERIRIDIVLRENLP